MTLLADLLSTVFERRHRRAPSDGADDRPIEVLAEALVGASGEISGRALAERLLMRFEALADDGKRAFFRHLVGTMGLDAKAVREALAALEASPGKASYRAYMAASEPPRQELIRRLNQVPQATGQLVRMREALLRLGAGDPELEALDLDFRHLFRSWFNRGFLVLRPINWASPAHILEKIIAYEAVHAIDSWQELRRRLEPVDRRCFAFFHPAMPDEPLIFVEVALTRGIPGSIQLLLAEDREPLAADAADTAVFYSISNCQEGLAGISFGNSLIKQVAADLAVELPELTTFVTLSPIPSFADWLGTHGQTAAAEPERLAQLAAHYLLRAKRADDQPQDPVARFHLGNGAELHAVHAEADTSPKGRAQSRGVMVNYLYDLKKVSGHHERYANDREVIAAPAVRAMAAQARDLALSPA